LALLLGASPAHAQTTDEPPVDVIQVSGLIDPVLVDFIDHALDDAETDGAQALVLQLNSKGATVGAGRMAELAARFEASRVPVAVWIGPSGSRGLGAAGQLVGAADFSGLAPGARIGDFGDPLPGRDPVGGAQADQLVHHTLGATDAAERNVVDSDAPTIGLFVLALDQLEAKGTTLSTARVVEGASGPTREATAQVRFAKLGVASQLFHTVASPPVAYLLLLIGLSLLLFEFFTAGVGVAGVVGAGCLLLATYGLAVLPARGWALALVVLSVLAFAIDVQTGVPRFWTAVGIAMLVVGSFFLYDGLSLSWVPLLVGIGGMLLAMISGMPAMVRTRFATPTIGREWMIGELGVAEGAVDPDGLVRVREARWPARTNRATPIGPGETIRVVAIDGVVLEVEPEFGGARDHRDRRTRE
jgi:membrane-bound serine protease (ClpP class)